MVGITSPELQLAVETLDLLRVPHLAPDSDGTIQTLPNSPHRDRGIMYAGDLAPQRLEAPLLGDAALSLSRFFSQGRFGGIVALQVGRDAREQVSVAVNDFALTAMSRGPNLVCASVDVVPATDYQSLPKTVIALCYGGKEYSPQELRALFAPNSGQSVDIPTRYGTHRVEPDAWGAMRRVVRIGGNVLAASGQLCIEFGPDENNPGSVLRTERSVPHLPLSAFVLTLPHTMARDYMDTQTRRAAKRRQRVPV